MTDSVRNQPAEVFGYPIANRSTRAEQIRRAAKCPFRDVRCEKKSRLLDGPFGVCSARTSRGVSAICPRRFEEPGSIEGVPRVLEEIARHYFGTTDDIVVFPEVRLPNVGAIDYVIVKHRPMKSEVEDFVAVEFQSDSTTGTGKLVEAFKHFVDGQDITGNHYRFGMNTYDSIKRAVTQLMNKGIVFERWETKCYWVIQEYIYENLVSRYGLAAGAVQPEHSTRFALYALRPQGDQLSLVATRVLSTSVDDVYRAMRSNPRLPDRSAFVDGLNKKLQLRLSVR